MSSIMHCGGISCHINIFSFQSALQQRTTVLREQVRDFVPSQLILVHSPTAPLHLFMSLGFLFLLELEQNERRKRYSHSRMVWLSPEVILLFLE